MGDARYADWDSFTRTPVDEFAYRPNQPVINYGELIRPESTFATFDKHARPGGDNLSLYYEPSLSSYGPPKPNRFDRMINSIGSTVKQEARTQAKAKFPKLHKLYAGARRVFGAVKPLAMAGYRAVKSFLTPPSAACGGKVTRTGVVKVHKGEMIVSAKHAKKAQRALADIAKRAKKSK